MKVLFICNQNQHRSKTAEDLFRSKFDVRSAGLFNNEPVKKNEIEWADKIVVMEDKQRTEIAKRFPKQYLHKQILSLDIPDIYSYNQPELVDILKTKVRELV